jgi:hypothetical protein
LKGKRNFKIDESDGHKTLNLEHFGLTLRRYGIELTDDERNSLFRSDPKP